MSKQTPAALHLWGVNDMFDNYYAVEYQLNDKKAELEKRLRFAWMQSDLKEDTLQSTAKAEISPQPCCYPAV